MRARKGFQAPCHMVGVPAISPHVSWLGYQPYRRLASQEHDVSAFPGVEWRNESFAPQFTGAMSPTIRWHCGRGRAREGTLRDELHVVCIDRVSDSQNHYSAAAGRDWCKGRMSHRFDQKGSKCLVVLASAAWRRLQPRCRAGDSERRFTLHWEPTPNKRSRIGSLRVVFALASRDADAPVNVDSRGGRRACRQNR